MFKIQKQPITLHLKAEAETRKLIRISFKSKHLFSHTIFLFRSPMAYKFRNKRRAKKRQIKKRKTKSCEGIQKKESTNKDCHACFP